ncbi:MAG: hybrid-cluster NAD(P)-dependent oxidoreductase [Cyanobacteria bacterium KgW148]|nr:hybrid-cluster NAD(P)-dependent oxidoreductase [Cyanobacteria bacterium KgW148]
MSSSPSRPDTLEITIKRVPAPNDVPDAPPGLVSNWMHDNVKVGSKILISGPLGKFTCADNPIGKLLLISAGSGITPMISMSRWIIDRILDYDIVFFHAARSVEDIIYRQELEWMSSRFSNFKLFITITRGNSGSPWFGLRGRLNHDMLQLVAPDFRERAVYVCGPNEFMAVAKALLEQEGYPMDNYHEESFGAPKKQKEPNREIRNETPPKKGILEELVSIKPASMPEVMISAPEPVEPRETASTMILFQKTGKTVSCSSDDTILEVAEQEGIKIRSSCRAGTCGTCKKKKLAGEVHLDNYDPEALEPEEIAEGYILTCVAYPRGKVILDA